jgi:hypothetical protein
MIQRIGGFSVAEISGLPAALAFPTSVEVDDGRQVTRMPSLSDVRALPGTKLTLVGFTDGGGGAADGQYTHPSVVYFAEPWNGYRYWMAATPLPSGVNTYENPCILASNDGTTWVVPAGGANPIATAPGGTFYSDTELVRDADRLWCVWRQVTGANGVLWASSSINGITWSPPVSIMPASTQTPVSPAIVRWGNGWAMWGVDISTGNTSTYVVRMYTANAIIGPWTAPAAGVATNLIRATSVFDPWHLAVLRANGHLLMLMYATANGAAPTGVYLCSSVDGVTWTIPPRPCMSVNALAGQFDTTQLYRASALLIHEIGGNDWLDIYYGAADAASDWWIGRTLAQLSHFGQRGNPIGFSRGASRYRSNGFGAGTFVPTTALFYCAPVVFNEAVSIGSFAIETTAGTASSVARIGVYEDKGGKPRKLIWDSGNIAVNATQVFEQAAGGTPALPLVLGPGTYWVGAQVTNAGTVSTCRASTGGLCSPDDATLSRIMQNAVWGLAFTGATPLPDEAAEAGNQSQINIIKVAMKIA